MTISRSTILSVIALFFFQNVLIYKFKCPSILIIVLLSTQILNGIEYFVDK